MTMEPKRKGVEVSIAISEAVMQCDVDCIAAYPITPQTHIVEHLADLVAEGELNAEFIPVESEHSAMSVCCGTSAAGARTFTSTSSQGLALMSEIVLIAASLRLPIVMALVNRSLSGPLSIWNDHSDVMSIRDCGWVQVFVENGQEAYDHTFFCFRVAEDPKVQLPVALNIDGFILSHMIEPIVYVEQEKINQYLPRFQPTRRLHPDKPVTMGAFAMPDIYTETRMAQDAALCDSISVIRRAWQEWKDLTGREYHTVESYRTEGAKTIVVIMGSLAETAGVAVDALRSKGEAVGLVSIRLWRPFPVEDFLAAVKDAETLVVIDRALSFGFGGPLAGEVRSQLYRQPKRPKVVNYIAGLASRDVQPNDFVEMIKRGREKADAGREDGYELYGVRS
jgi:pyruvate ferredoxin oxidoreductase alpha subunit